MINIELILSELDTHLPNWRQESQISLQSTENNIDSLEGTGAVRTLKCSEKFFKVPTFNNLTYTNSIIEKLNMHRTRIMILKGRSCYTYHRDFSKRIHIPLITNKDNFFVIEDQVSRYPATGDFYIIDTTKKHTFVNSSLEDRVHIVGCI